MRRLREAGKLNSYNNRKTICSSTFEFFLQLNTGDRLYIMPDDSFLCKDDYNAQQQRNGGSNNNGGEAIIPFAIPFKNEWHIQAWEDSGWTVSR